MAINLQKGADVNLAREVPALKKVIIGLGWEPRPAGGAVFDLDSCAFLLRGDGKVRDDTDFIFYNNLSSEDGSVEHTGDNRTGVGAGDDERLTVDLERVAPDIERIVFAVTIHEAEARKQDFGMVGKAFIRCLDAASDREIARFDLSDESALETSMIFGELYRSGGEWRFRGVGQGFRGGVAPLARSFGVDA